MKNAKTLYEKVLDLHKVCDIAKEKSQYFISLHLLHEVTSPQAFDFLREKNLKVAFPEFTQAVIDHVIPTDDLSRPFADEQSEIMTKEIEKNTKEFGINFFSPDSENQGVVHISPPELGMIQPGKLIVCGDSHTCTHGAFGAVSFGIGTTEVFLALATGTVVIKPVEVKKIEVISKLKKYTVAKDVILYILSELGTEYGISSVYEFGGETLEKMSMEERMTICNMSVEGGAKSGYFNPDKITFDYLKEKKYAPKKDFDKAVEFWKSLATDDEYKHEETLTFSEDIGPMVTYGTDPSMAIDIDKDDTVPFDDEYMGLKKGDKLTDTNIDVAFIGSCTNGRLSDLKCAAEILKGNKVSVKTLIVPGSKKVKKEAEKLGLDKIFKDAGAEWRNPGCSMCLAMNPDKLKGNQRSLSTSNRNFKGRQGSPTGRTHLASPYTVAVSAIRGKITNPIKFMKK